MLSKTIRVLAVAATAMALAASTAGADILSTSTGFGGSDDLAPGGHGTLTVGGEFQYSSASEDLRRFVVDFPAGGFGNPNAIPYADRCLPETFQTAQCDVKSQIGVVNLVVSVDGLGELPLTGQLYEIQSTPEVPTKVGAYVQPELAGAPIGSPIRANAVFYPVTSGPDGDFRIRSVAEPFPRTAVIAPGVELPIQIKKYEQVIWGRLDNGTPFITNPTRCDTWMSYGYVEAYDSTTNADTDPLGEGKTFVKLPDVPTQPNCANLAPFGASGTASLSSVPRGASPELNVNLSIPGISGDPISAAVPKTISTVLPDAVNVDIQRIATVCENAQFDARACPAGTKVGSVRITLPMIAAGLTGDAYIVRRSAGGTGLPDLGLIVSGAINFNQRGTNSYTGNGTQIRTTFDNIPQPGFSTLDLKIFGGTNGLLRVDECPDGGRNPLDAGPVTFALTSYQGQTRQTASPEYRAQSCFSSRVKLKRFKRCLKSHSLRISPTFKSRGEVRKVTYRLPRARLKTVKKSPFRLHTKLSRKLKKGKTYKYTVRTYFKQQQLQSKAVVKKTTGHFRLCR